MAVMVNAMFGRHGVCLIEGSMYRLLVFVTVLALRTVAEAVPPMDTPTFVAKSL